jgi:hypothetical protein
MGRVEIVALAASETADFSVDAAEQAKPNFSAPDFPTPCPPRRQCPGHARRGQGVEKSGSQAPDLGARTKLLIVVRERNS